MADMAEGVVVIRQVLTLRGIHFLFFKDVKFTCKGKLVFTSVRFSISFNNNLKAETNKKPFCFCLVTSCTSFLSLFPPVFSCVSDQVTMRA